MSEYASQLNVIHAAAYARDIDGGGAKASTAIHFLGLTALRL
jgi:hypothetical protein